MGRGSVNSTPNGSAFYTLVLDYGADAVNLRRSRLETEIESSAVTYFGRFVETAHGRMVPVGVPDMESAG